MAGAAVLTVLFSIRRFLATPVYRTALSRLGCVFLRRAVPPVCVAVCKRKTQSRQVGRSFNIFLLISKKPLVSAELQRESEREGAGMKM